MARDPRPLIAVLGATGAPGGSVARALLARGRFAVRAVTRHPGSDAAQALEMEGAELYAADLDEPSSLRAAFEGAQGLFATTAFWAARSPERTLAQARHIADAACDARIAHVVWSTQEDTRRWVPLDDQRAPTLGGRWKVPSFDARGAADALFRERGLATTLLRTPFFWDHLAHPALAPWRDADGALVLSLPIGDALLPGMAAADVGACVLPLFEQPRRWIGAGVGLAGEHAGGARMALALAQACGEPVRHLSPGLADYAAGAAPGAAELAAMFRFVHDFNPEFCAARPLAATRALHPGVLDFAGWLALNRHRLLLPRCDAKAARAAGAAIDAAASAAPAPSTGILPLAA